MAEARTADAPLTEPVRVGPVAHGGHFVARYDGRVVFVRHALPGELVRIALTDTGHERFWRGDAVEIVEPSPARVVAPCPVAGPGGCGGCDFQHVEPAAQRELKAAVVAEQLRRLAGITWAGEVEAVEPLLGWRTRMRYQVDEQGRAGLRAHRSHRVVALPDDGCRIAHPAAPEVTGRIWPAGHELLAIAAASGPELHAGDAAGAFVRERAAGRDWTVAADGFWQVHPAAADTLVDAVVAGLAPRPGERAFDLYCGVGLFAGALADRGCQAWGVESDRRAIDLARANLAGSHVRFSAGRVDRVLRRLPARTDLVVLDPPRTGAGRGVMEAVLERSPRSVAYVACDPVPLARDLRTATAAGYALASLRAFDLFPMTHHVECVAILSPAR